MSDFIERAIQEIKSEIIKYRSFQGSRKDFVIGVWHLRNKARRVCRKLENTELLDEVISLVKPEERDLFDLCDAIYETGYFDGREDY